MVTHIYSYIVFI